MCNHTKIYKNDVLLASFPPKYMWKCSKCGKEGYDLKNHLGKIEFDDWHKKEGFFKSLY